MKRKVILLLLIISTALSLLSCNDKTSNSNRDNNSSLVNNSSSNSNTDVTIEHTEHVEEIIYPEIRTSFIGCGDNIIYGTKEAVIHAKGTGRKYNYKPYYSGVADIISDADISFINQETLMCGEGYALSYYPMFNSPQELGYDLQELGFDVVNISNNHMLDKGSDGLLSTIKFWKSFEDVLMIGGYENQDDYNSIRYIEKDGIKIAFLSYTQMTNGLVKSPYSDVIVPYTNDDIIKNQTEIAGNEADFVIVSVHWGQEGMFSPDDEQKRLAQLFADCGVDVIIGHHPHVLQPVEWLYGKDGNQTLCVYSLGNFMAQQAFDYNMVGGIISFDIVHSEITDPYIDNVIMHPTVFHFNGAFTQNNVYLMENYSAELASQHGVRNYYGHAFSYERVLKYATDTINSEFLPSSLKDETN